jgi:hypothetical protein
MQRPSLARAVAIAAGPILMIVPRGVIELRGVGFAYEKVELLALKLAASLVVLALVIAALRYVHRLGERRADDLLVLAASLGVAIWFNFGAFHGRATTHHWEQFHHFLGSRYFAELGYDGLYAASLGDHADHAADGWVPEYTRDLRNNQITPSDELVPQMREVYARFTPERWADFSRDHAFFLTWDSFGDLTRFRTDHGYNASPTWTFVAQWIGRWQPASMAWMIALGSLDVLLLAGMFALMWRTFGMRPACLAIVLFGTGFLPEFEFVGMSFLRFDWLAAVGIAACMLERKRPAVAGALIGYATAVRVFPVLFLVGPAVLALRALWRGERPAWLAPLGAGFGAALLVSFGAGCLAGRGVEAWPEFAREVRSHSKLWFNNNVGLENVVLYDWDVLSASQVTDYFAPEPWLEEEATVAQRKIDRSVELIAVRGAFLAVVVAAVWRGALVEAVAASMAAIFALLSPANYYWGMLSLAVLRPRPGIPLALLTASVLARVVALLDPAYEMRYGTQSWALTLIFLAWLGPDALATLRAAWADLRSRYTRVPETMAS